jgi:hypothetical protein
LGWVEGRGPLSTSGCQASCQTPCRAFAILKTLQSRLGLHVLDEVLRQRWMSQREGAELEPRFTYLPGAQVAIAGKWLHLACAWTEHLLSVPQCRGEGEHSAPKPASQPAAPGLSLAHQRCWNREQRPSGFGLEARGCLGSSLTRSGSKGQPLPVGLSPHQAQWVFMSFI